LKIVDSILMSDMWTQNLNDTTSYMIYYKIV